MSTSTHLTAASCLLSILFLVESSPGQSANPATRPAANHLAGQTSPFLQQHADNPVAWYPWGQEAFDKATREDKPIFLSIGYSTCHWCHVMERESFEDPAIAGLINDNFVPILVDREQRPDVDRIYVTYVMALRGSAGWPLNVFLTPDLKPFFGATYFPPVEMEGAPSFRTILTRVAESWQKDRDRIGASADRAVAALAEIAAVQPDPAAQANEALLAAAFDQFRKEFDPADGGFGPAPEFPPPMTLRFLLHYHARTGDVPAREMVLKTLRAMADGGIHDQLGGGFHRYATDAHWFLPHFEKMLYDQAQLADSYLDAYQLTRDPAYAGVARDVLDYVLRDMTGPDGQFYTAEDADSAADPARPAEMSEGAFYVWTAGQIEAVVGQEAAAVFDFRYGVAPGGNVAADPRKEFTGKSVLANVHTIDETAKKFDKSAEQMDAVLKESRAKLLAARQARPRPHRDEKAIAGWNGMMIGALARAGPILEEPAYTRAAVRAATFLRDRLYDSSSKTLFRSWRSDRDAVEAFAEDYAMAIAGLIDLYESSLDIQWLKLAIELQSRQDALFWDAKSGGYFSTTDGAKSLVLRMKETSDGDMPSANSMAALNALRLAEMTGDKQLRQRAEKTLAAFAPALRASPASLPQMLVALDFALSKPRQIVMAGTMDAEGVLAMQREVAGHYRPNTVMLLADGGEGQRFLGTQLEFMKSVAMVRDQATAYVCENYTCQLPTTDLSTLRRQLASPRRGPTSAPAQ